MYLLCRLSLDFKIVLIAVKTLGQANMLPACAIIYLLVAIVSKALFQTVHIFSLRKLEGGKNTVTDSLLSLLLLSSIVGCSRRSRALLRASSTSFSSSPSFESKSVLGRLSATSMRSCSLALHAEVINHVVMRSVRRARRDDAPSVIVSSGRYWL